MGTTVSVLSGTVFLSVIVLLYLVALGTGAQSVTTDRDARRSDGSNKYKGVRQQGITEC